MRKISPMQCAKLLAKYNISLTQQQEERFLLLANEIVKTGRDMDVMKIKFETKGAHNA